MNCSNVRKGIPWSFIILDKFFPEIIINKWKTTEAPSSRLPFGYKLVLICHGGLFFYFTSTIFFFEKYFLPLEWYFLEKSTFFLLKEGRCGGGMEIVEHWIKTQSLILIEKLKPSVQNLLNQRWINLYTCKRRGSGDAKSYINKWINHLLTLKFEMKWTSFSRLS